MRSYSLLAPFPAEAPTPHALVAPHETSVYRFYGEQEQLLYIGVSWAPFKRWAYHRRNAAWFSRAQVVQVDVYRSRRTALRIEREGIREQAPAFNVRSTMR